MCRRFHNRLIRCCLFFVWRGVVCFPASVGLPSFLPSTPAAHCRNYVSNARAPRPSPLLHSLPPPGAPIVHQRVPVLRGDALPRHPHHEGRGPGNFGHQGSTGRVLHGQRYPGASVGACSFLPRRQEMQIHHVCRSREEVLQRCCVLVNRYLCLRFA